MSIQTERQRASQIIADLGQNTFFRRYWRAIGSFLGRGKPVSIWVSGAIIMSANLLLGVTISVLLRETQFTNFDGILKNCLWVAVAYFLILPFLFINARMIDFIHVRFVDSLRDEQDIRELIEWAEYWLGRRIPQLLFSIGFGIVIALLGFYSVYPLTKFSFGPTFIYFINFFHGAVGFYGLLSLFAFMLKLNKLNLMLFPNDPASSPILIQLSRELRDYILFIAFASAVMLVMINIIAALNILAIIVMVVVVWIPIIALFILGNHALSQQIKRVKYESLEKIQSQIMELSNKGKMDKETIAYTMNLMDYHDRIKATRHSLYNTESFTNLLASLALPFLGAILSAIDIWQKILGKP